MQILLLGVKILALYGITKVIIAIITLLALYGITKVIIAIITLLALYGITKVIIAIITLELLYIYRNVIYKSVCDSCGIYHRLYKCENTFPFALPHDIAALPSPPAPIDIHAHIHARVY